MHLLVGRKVCTIFGNGEFGGLLQNFHMQSSIKQHIIWKILKKDGGWWKPESIIPFLKKMVPDWSLMYSTMKKYENGFISCKPLNLGKLNYQYLLLE